jgi:hypothetical protein
MSYGLALLQAAQTMERNHENELEVFFSSHFLGQSAASNREPDQTRN